MVYLGEVSWKVPVAPQAEIRDAQFKSECLMAVKVETEKQSRSTNKKHFFGIELDFSVEAYFRQIVT